MYFNRHNVYRLALLFFTLFAWTLCEIVVLKKQQDKIYRGHVLFELSMPMWSLCAQFCSRIEVCKSINFIALNKTCQINDAEPGEGTGELIESTGNSFIAASTFPQKLAGQCEENDCKRNEVCMPRGPDYYCVPLPVELSECSTPSHLVPRDCGDLPQGSLSGVYTIYPANHGFDVYCDMDTAGFGWTVFQSRMNGTVDFYREWKEYETGFGNLDSEFWLGNNKLNVLTSTGNYKLFIHLEDFEGNSRYAEYSKFSVGDATTNFILNIDGYSGDAGDEIGNSNDMMFSTSDRDNDRDQNLNCAKDLRGGWWYYFCLRSNLNGRYSKGNNWDQGIIWVSGDEWQSLKSTKMMIKRI